MASRIDSPTPADGDRARVVRERAFAAKRVWHEEQAALSPVEKVEQLLRMQAELLPILSARRPLARHERPWSIRP